MIQQTNLDLRLRELLIVWEEARERGESLTAAALCRDCPELVDELKQQIQALRDWELLTPDSSARSSSSSEAAAPALACAPASACLTVQLSDLRFHDRGGLGVIYKARHQDLPRDIALKFIRQDRSDDPLCSERFLREAQITARLEHPGIVPIYGLGRDENGNPCYAMRFVEGTTLEQASKQYHAQPDHDRKRGSLGTDRAFRALLQRFKSACTTVGYAHSRGVLHRDIKPANIMLGPFDETLVLDWGLGKIIASDDAEVAGEHEREARLPSPGSDELERLTIKSHTPPGRCASPPNPPFTRGGQYGGPARTLSPPYEGGQGGFFGRGPRACASQSLSALETCEVIGTPGFMSPEQHAGQWEKVGRASDIYGLGATLYVLLTGRTPFEGRSPGEIASKVDRGEFTPPREVKPAIPRPLEAICLKAMAKAPEDRYTSAIDLAGDLENWMVNEPVSAWSEPWSVRARRWTGRNRTLVTTGAVAALLVVMALIAIVVQQDRSNRNLAARNEELRQVRARAEKRVRLALNAIDQFRGAVADNPKLKYQPEFAQLRQDLLRAPQEFYRQLKQDIEESQDTSPEAWAGLAKVVLGLAQITGEIDSRPNAIRAYQEGVGILDRLFSGRPDDPTLRILQAGALLQLARLQSEEGKLPEAVNNNERAREILERLIGQRPEDANLRLELGRAYDQLGLTRLDAERFERAREILEAPESDKAEGTRHHLYLAMVYNHLGMMRRKAGSLDQALAFYERALRLQEHLVREQPNDPRMRFTLASLLHNIGNLRLEISRGGAVESYERANAIFELLVREYRSIADFRMNYARCLGNLAVFTWYSRDHTRAILAFKRVAELLREGVELHPNVVTFRYDLGLTLYHLARGHLFVDRPQDALKYAQEGVERLDALLATGKDPLGRARSLLGMIWEKRADALVALGRENEAVEALRAAIGHQRKAIEQDPRSDVYREELLKDHYQLVALHCILGQTHEAAAALEVMQPLWPDNPGNLFSITQELAQGWSKATGDQGGRIERTGTATQLYGALVVTMLERSVKAGFRDFMELINDPAFEPFRTRDDFQRLLWRMMDLAFPVDPFAR
jgi:serine/threonine protein kinase